MERRLQQKHEAAGHAGSTVKVQPKMNGRAHVVSLLPFFIEPRTPTHEIVSTILRIGFFFCSFTYLWKYSYKYIHLLAHSKFSQVDSED